MTETDYNLLKEKLEHFDSLTVEKKALKEAIEKLTSLECASIQIELGENKIFWQAKDDKRWLPVCGSLNKSGLVTEIRNALIGILSKRLDRNVENLALL